MTTTDDRAPRASLTQLFRLAADRRRKGGDIVDAARDELRALADRADRAYRVADRRGWIGSTANVERPGVARVEVLTVLELDDGTLEVITTGTDPASAGVDLVSLGEWCNPTIKRDRAREHDALVASEATAQHLGQQVTRLTTDLGHAALSLRARRIAIEALAGEVAPHVLEAIEAVAERHARLEAGIVDTDELERCSVAGCSSSACSDTGMCGYHHPGHQ